MSPTPAPLEVFQKTIQYFPTVSVNIVLRNKAGEFLFVRRKNNPAKGLWWVPGGRILNGETMEEAAHRILKAESGLEAKLLYLSKTYLEEIFDTKDFDEADRHIYPTEVKTVHYVSTAALMEIAENQEVKLDFQSDNYRWQSELPNNHPYLKSYFDLVKGC